MAEDHLKAKTPDEYHRLKDSGELEDRLDQIHHDARRAYEAKYREILRKDPKGGTWAMMAPQEIVVRDLLDPTT